MHNSSAFSRRETGVGGLCPFATVVVVSFYFNSSELIIFQLAVKPPLTFIPKIMSEARSLSFHMNSCSVTNISECVSLLWFSTMHGFRKCSRCRYLPVISTVAIVERLAFATFVYHVNDATLHVSRFGYYFHFRVSQVCIEWRLCKFFFGMNAYFIYRTVFLLQFYLFIIEHN